MKRKTIELILCVVSLFVFGLCIRHAVVNDQALEYYRSYPVMLWVPLLIALIAGLGACLGATYMSRATRKLAGFVGWGLLNCFMLVPAIMFAYAVIDWPWRSCRTGRMLLEREAFGLLPRFILLVIGYIVSLCFLIRELRRTYGRRVPPAGMPGPSDG